MSLGQRMKHARTLKKMTQSFVAETIGIDDTTISKYENDKSEPDLATIRKMSELYDTNVNWLITGKGDRENRHFSDPHVSVSHEFIFAGKKERLTEEEARHLRDSLEMFRLLKEKRIKEKQGSE